VPSEVRSRKKNKRGEDRIRGSEWGLLLARSQEPEIWLKKLKRTSLILSQEVYESPYRKITQKGSWAPGVHSLKTKDKCRGGGSPCTAWDVPRQKLSCNPDVRRN